MFLRTSDRGFACHVMLDGYWEMWLTQFLARRVEPGSTVIDVGANFGYYTLLFADAVGDAGRVIAVEPNPDAAILLRETVLLNGHSARTQIVPHALAATAGNGWLYAPYGEPKNATLVGRPDVPDGQTIEVSTLTLDEIALPYEKVALVKIDAEGGELGIVTGMQKLIARDHPTIVLEFNPARYPDPKRFLEQLAAAYDVAHELSLDGELLPLDAQSVIDKTNLQDRILVFG